MLQINIKTCLYGLYAESHSVHYSDREYPRLGQMIVDYENPLKKMMEEFVPHGKVGELFVFI